MTATAQPTRYVDATPTWAGIMPALIAALQHGTPEGQELAREELMRLASLTDSRNEAAKAAEAKGAAQARLSAKAAEAASMARACLAAYPVTDRALQGNGQSARAARDIREALAALVDGGRT